MKGDYLRYLTEVSTKELKKVNANESLNAYKTATQISDNELLGTNPIRLELALNFSVFYYEIMNSTEISNKIAKKAFDEALIGIDNLNEESYKEITFILQLFKNEQTGVQENLAIEKLQLNLLKRKQENLFSHWALLWDIPYKSSTDRNKKVYHLHKDNGVGKYENFTFSDSNKTLETTEIGQLQMDHDDFDDFCFVHNKNFRENTVGNNCQNWCNSVVNKLKVDGKLNANDKVFRDTNEKCTYLYYIRLSSKSKESARILYEKDC